MKNFIKNIGQWSLDILAWLVKWIPIFLAMGIFTLCSVVIAGWIGNRIWMLFIADIVFYILLWKLFLLTFPPRPENKKWTVFVIIVLTILLVLIAMMTFGMGFVTSPIVLLNIYIFPIGFVATLATFSIRYFERRAAKNRSV
jgi:hypothetical protein